MKYDSIIIGGGLSGLVCGIRLQKAGKRCAVISSGQSALHFSSGSFDFLDRLPDGTVVTSPLESVASLEPVHPYSLIGAEKVRKYAFEVKDFFRDCGITLNGDPSGNGYRITPVGEFRPAWLAIDDFELYPSGSCKIAENVLIVNIFGYLDFNTKFIAEAIESRGIGARVVSVRIEEMERLRQNPSEMRSTNIARVMDREDVCDRMIAAIANEYNGEDAIMLPAVFGLKSESVIPRIRGAFKAKVHFVATMPPSVPGIRTQLKLRSEFERLGGTYLLGDTVNSAEMTENSVVSIGTVNFGNISLTADNYVLASGSFFSKGLIAVPDRIYEPVFGLDVLYEAERKDWYDAKLFNRQNYISFGVKVGKGFHPSRNGEAIGNLFAIGSVLGGYNALSEGSGAGVAIISAMYVADIISGKEERQ